MMDKTFASELKNKTILITGGSGFFGKNLCEFLVSLNKNHNANIKIIAMARKKFEMSGVVFFEQDITQKILLTEHVDLIIHAATPVVNDKSTNDELLNIIINGTQNIISWAKKSHVKKFLLVSSGAVYGAQPSDVEKISEEYFEQVSLFDAKNAYGTGKRLSEIITHQLLKNSGIEYSIARCFAFSGKYLALDQHFAIGNFVRDVVDGTNIFIKGDGKALRSYMDNVDLCNWTIAILINGKNGEAYNVGSDQEISIKDLAYKISSFVPGTSVQIENVNSTNLKSNRYIPSTLKAEKELGLKLTISLDESIKKMIELYKDSKK